MERVIFVQSVRWLHSHPDCAFVLLTPFSLSQVTEQIWLKCQYFPRSEVMGKQESMQEREEGGWEQRVLPIPFRVTRIGVRLACPCKHHSSYYRWYVWFLVQFLNITHDAEQACRKISLSNLSSVLNYCKSSVTGYCQRVKLLLGFVVCSFLCCRTTVGELITEGVLSPWFSFQRSKKGDESKSQSSLVRSWCLSTDVDIVCITDGLADNADVISPPK